MLGQAGRSATQSGEHRFELELARLLDGDQAFLADGDGRSQCVQARVLCIPVPPEISMYQPDWTAASRNVAASGLSVPSATRSSSVLARRRNFRTVTWVQRDVNGGMTALRREPSGRRASTSGLVSSSRRPRRPTARRTIRSNSASSSKNTS